MQLESTHDPIALADPIPARAPRLTPDRGRPDRSERAPGTYERRDLIAGTVIALVMGTVFTVVGGQPLVVTFIPGLAVSWLVFLRMYRRRTELPATMRFLPVYLVTLAWQFIHFTEEFVTGFYDRFPLLYRPEPYSQAMFVGFNMASYVVFVVGSLLVFTKGLRFFLTPVLFFIVYGAIGNAIAHTWWVVAERSYFPGFYTAQLYWVIGPMVLARLIGSTRDALLTVALLAGVLVPILAVFARST